MVTTRGDFSEVVNNEAVLGRYHAAQRSAFFEGRKRTAGFALKNERFSEAIRAMKHGGAASSPEIPSWTLLSSLSTRITELRGRRPTTYRAEAAHDHLQFERLAT
jgi:hypothetical protein